VKFEPLILREGSMFKLEGPLDGTYPFQITVHGKYVILQGNGIEKAYDDADVRVEKLPLLVSSLSLQALLEN
jgi:hypothetical protein